MLHRHPIARLTATALLATCSAGLAGCSETEPEEGVSVGDVQAGGEGGPTLEKDEEYDGSYDADFEESVVSYAGQTVTVSAEVGRVLDDHAFTIVGPEDEVEPLVVVHQGDVPEIEDGTEVSVTGLVHKDFDVPGVEDQLQTDMDDAVLEDFEKEPYIEAVTVESEEA